MSIRIATNSPCDIPLNEARQIGVDIVPLKIVFDGREYREGVDMGIEEFYVALKSSFHAVTTSQPSPMEYLTLIEDAKRAKDSLIILAMASSLSGAYQSAVIAKEMSDYPYVYVIDTHQAIMGLRLMVEHAVKLRDSGMGAPDIVEELIRLRPRVVIWSMVDTLEYLHRGGRISAAVKILGSLLNIKPIVSMRENLMSMIDRARGFQASVKSIFKHIDSVGGISPQFPVYYGYTDTSEQCLRFKALADERYGLTDSKVFPVGGVVGAHVGPGAFALCHVMP